MVIRFFFLCLIFNLVLAQFDWIDDGAPIRQGQHIEWQRTAGSGDTGEIIFGWSDTRTSMRDVYVQKIDSEGNRLWGEKGIAVTTAYGRQEDPLLVGDDSGGAFIIWIDYRSEPDTEGDVYAQHVLSDGSLAWPLEQPIVVKEGAQRNPNMCKDGNGGAYIIWKDFTLGQYEHVYATHISSNNEIINPGQGIPIMTNDSHHNGISLEIAGLGEAAMAWVDDRNGNLDIFAQRILADHENNTINTLWSTVEEGGTAICDEDGDQNYAKITYAAGCCGTEGITATTWQDDRNQNFDIYMQYLWVDGEPYFQDYPQGLPLTEGLSSSQTKPRIKADNSGAYVVWYSDQNGNSDIYAQKIIASQDDPIQWLVDGLPICTAEDAQTGARLSVSGNGGAYFAWQDDRNGGDEADVYIQHIGAENVVTMPENGLIISDAALIQKSPVVRNDGNGSAFVIWEDGRRGSGGIYTQHLNSQGELTLSDDGMEIYYGVDGASDNIESERINDNEILLYWEDRENGVNSTSTFGKIVSNDYGLSYDDANSVLNAPLSLNQAQVKAEVKKVGNDLFMGFLQDNNQAGVEPFEGYSQYFQILDLPNLNLQGDTNGTRLNSTDSYLYDYIDVSTNVDLLVNEDNSLFYFTSLSVFWAGPDIYVRKVGIDGTIYWDAPKNLTNDSSSDNFIKKVFNAPNGGAFIVFDQNGGSGNYGNITIMNQDGENIEGFPKRICDIESDQFIEDAVDTGEGVFMVWRDGRQEGSDIYGQYFDYSGNALGSMDGIPIATYDYDQTNAKISFHNDLNEILVCWEDYSSGQDYDLLCNTVDLNTLEVNQSLDGSPLYLIANGQGDQINVYTYKALNGRYMITWEDSRNNSDENLQTHTDIYYQEIDNGEFVYGQNGLVLCDAYHIQTEPKIALYSQSQSEQSYLVYWSDLRSTGKDLLYNIYGQSITHNFELSVEDDINKEFSINAIYPNPFNPEVNISFFNPINNQVSIKIYDLNGRLINAIYDNFLSNGYHTFKWDAQDYSSGIYIVTIGSENSYISSKISLLK